MIQDFLKENLTNKNKLGFFLLCALLLLAIAISSIPTIQQVSSRVGDRELPIYCVETDKKQIALSFDAAW